MSDSERKSTDERENTDKQGGGDAGHDKRPSSQEGTNDKRHHSEGSPTSGGSESVSRKGGQVERKRKDGTRNKMSFDVDELEEGLYIEVEDEEEVEEVVEYEEVADDEVAMQEGGITAGGVAERKAGSIKNEDPKAKATTDENSGYKIRPDLTRKFRPGMVQIIIEKSIKDHLENKELSAEECEECSRLIVEDIHEKVKSQNYKRYKIITHVTLGERRGEGASSATRCLWDAEADCMATYTFLNDSMFCNGTVYGIYFY